MTYIVLSLRGKYLAVGKLQGWLLWEEARSWPLARHKQFQLAPKQSHCGTTPSLLTMLAAPLKTYLQKGKTKCAAAVRTRSEKMWAKQPFRHQGGKKEGGGGALSITAEPCSLWRPWWSNAPAVRGIPHRNRSVCYSLWRTPQQSRRLHPEDAAMESLCWSRLPAGTVAWGTHASADFSRWTVPMEMMRAGAVLNRSPWEGPMLEWFLKDCVTWEGLHTAAGETCDVEDAEETKCCGLITASIPHPSCTTQRSQEWRSKVEPGKKREVGGRYFRAVPVLLTALFLFGNKLIFSQSSLFARGCNC